MHADQFEVAQSAITQLVKFYSSKYWWADSSDLAQEAWAACVNAAPGFKPELGDMHGYFYSVAKYAVTPFVMKQRAIVSSSRAERGELFKVRLGGFDEACEELEAASPDLEIDRLRWRAAIRNRLAKIFASMEGGEMAEACIVEDKQAQTVAAAFGVPVSAVYSATRKAKRAVANDRALFDLWRRDERNEN